MMLRFNNLLRDRHGGVSVIGALSLVSVIGIAALSIELGQGYQAKVTTQAVADSAALAAAVAFSHNKQDAILTPTANSVANANGIATSAVTVTQVSNYSADVDAAVRVVVRRNIPLYFARIFSTGLSYTVLSEAVAPLSASTTPACFIALLPSGTGIQLSGGTRINAPNCGINSNAAIAVTGGSGITAKATSASKATTVSGGSIITADTVTSGNGATVQAGSTITGSQKTQSNSTPDPMAGSTAIAAAQAKLGNFTEPQVPSVPTGEDLTLGYYPTTMTFQGRSASLVNGTWTFPAGTYNIRNLNTQSLTLKIEGPSTVTVSAGVTVGGGGKLIIGDGPVSIKAPITLGGGTSMTIGAGRHHIGQITLSGGSKAQIGAGDLDVNGAILIDGGGSSMTVGAGNYAIGRNGSGTAINLSGGSTLVFGDGTFSANGSITTSGGSGITFGATANHLINGNLSLQGSSTFGAGTYTINGSFTNNTGGKITGSNVSFILAGTLNMAGGTNVMLTAPTTSQWGIPDLLFATTSSAATRLAGGSQNQFGGMLHLPNSDLDMTGGVSATGRCFMVAARTITIASGPSAATYCDSMGSGSNGVTTIRLVQ
ncbi:pilus assembly protein TadG-related protein [Sphingomonas colocasiae]|uniref:Flp pilus-assembly TadG-like N-terminal domain-containing protein n=1 Tax=Sphingomonas colocasiae TaxID=1848973 RepID=A0ABS7PIZ8_9SPHN|nr:pilus assembly protein TadG-related protein [Sphingomonas colocasiae]MBY8821275.1 hypothetical protein [Sphingomonas colocasiae]